MKTLLLTHGSRGDVQPFAALAAALTGAGHEVVLAAPSSTAELAAPHCACVIPLDDGTNKLVDDRAAWEAVETGFRGVRGKRLGLEFLRHNRSAMTRVFDDLAELARSVTGVDVVVHQVNVPGHAIAEHLGVPAVPVCLQPFWVPTPSFADPLCPVSLPPALNEWSYLTTKLFVRAFTGGIRRWRSSLGLPRRRYAQDPLRHPDGSRKAVLQAFSRHVLPPWARYPDPVHTTGFFFLPAPPGWRPPASLSRFLAAGEPPVYLGFGSMVGSDPARTGRIVADALRMVGVRAVVAVGRGGIVPDGLGDDVHYLSHAPHDWLFPRMSAIVHHGGAGTTGAALAAGRPQVICPFMFDQPFFARRLHARGVAATPQPLRDLTSAGLASAIEEASDVAVVTRAGELGELVRAEDGVRAAVKLVESMA